jgi:hypothetical protein
MAALAVVWLAFAGFAAFLVRSGGEAGTWAWVVGAGVVAALLYAGAAAAGFGARAAGAAARGWRRRLASACVALAYAAALGLAVVAAVMLLRGEVGAFIVALALFVLGVVQILLLSAIRRKVP